MYDQIAEHSPGAASINEAIRLERARQRASIIGRASTLSARLAAMAADANADPTAWWRAG